MKNAIEAVTQPQSSIWKTRPDNEAEQSSPEIFANGRLNQKSTAPAKIISLLACAGTPECRTCPRPFPAAPARAKPPFPATNATQPAYPARRSTCRAIAAARSYAVRVQPVRCPCPCAAASSVQLVASSLRGQGPLLPPS